MKLRLIDKASSYFMVRGGGGLKVRARLCTCKAEVDTRCVLLSAWF